MKEQVRGKRTPCGVSKGATVDVSAGRDKSDWRKVSSHQQRCSLTKVDVGKLGGQRSTCFPVTSVQGDEKVRCFYTGCTTAWL